MQTRLLPSACSPSLTRQREDMQATCSFMGNLTFTKWHGKRHREIEEMSETEKKMIIWRRIYWDKRVE